MVKCVVNYIDGRTEEVKLITSEQNSRIFYTMDSVLKYDEIKHIDFWLNDFEISTGDAGYYLLPGGPQSSKLLENAVGYFKDRPNTLWENIEAQMPVLGIRHSNGNFIAIAEGMKEQSAQVVSISDGKYNFALRINIDGKEPFDDISILEIPLTGDKDYSEMARVYRKYLLENGFCSIRERKNAELSYAAESLYVRIRMGWKPVPATVLEQTVENEPPMHVACTFSDVEKIMHEYKRAGVEKAEFCLVGWNVKGHDGRWPQIFPVEEAFGGEEGIKKVIKTAGELGYAITCHTNSTEAYSIAENFSKDDIRVNEKGELATRKATWSGGRPYILCPKRAYELGMEDLPKVAELGFRGLHYIDVITIVVNHECCSELHPLNVKQSNEYNDKLLGAARDLFGGVGCEGGYVYTLKNCDFAFYASILKNTEEKIEIIDEYVPFWQLVFHGIVLSNPYSGCVNAIISPNPLDMLKLIEYGGRPCIYFHGHFKTDKTNWLGTSDFVTETDACIREAAQYAKEFEDIFSKLAPLQYEFMDKHEKTAEGVYRVTYSDGSAVIVDYNDNTYKLIKAGK